MLVHNQVFFPKLFFSIKSNWSPPKNFRQILFVFGDRKCLIWHHREKEPRLVGLSYFKFISDNHFERIFYHGTLKKQFIQKNAIVFLFKLADGKTTKRTFKQWAFNKSFFSRNCQSFRYLLILCGPQFSITQTVYFSSINFLNCSFTK